jgi:hypothetical protein
MKLIGLSVFLFLAVCPIIAQTDITGAVVDAFKKGDAAALSQLCNEQVELSVSGQEDLNSRAEAKSVLSTFFSRGSVKSFSIKHQGNSKMDDQYRIGELVTTFGTYRVTFFMKRTPSAMVIRQLKIEAPDNY